jgi:putative sterol carrier protein
MPTQEEVQAIFDKMPERFKADAASGMNAVYQYDITGDGGGKWYTAIADGNLTVEKGEHENPNITITVADQDYIDMVTGKLNGQTAFLTGKLKIKGDMSLAMKLNSLFEQG